MGNGMNKIVPGLYLGNFRDAKDELQLQENNITHILAIHDNAKKMHEDKEYLCINASDSASQDLLQYFSQCNDFIHRARLSEGNVLVHCLAGVSRSVTVVVAYVMTITDLSWRDALNAVRGARRCANPNFGFQRQLQTFEHEKLPEEKKRFKKSFAANPFKTEDEKECKKNMGRHRQWVMCGDDPDTGLYPLGHNVYDTKKTDSESSNANASAVPSQAANSSGHQSAKDLNANSAGDGQDIQRDILARYVLKSKATKDSANCNSKPSDSSVQQQSDVDSKVEELFSSVGKPKKD